MKKNYVKPSLLSETFVANNIMSSEENKNTLSESVDLYLNGEKITGITFTDGNTLNTININDFQK